MARVQPNLEVDPDASIEINAARIIPLRVAELLAWEPFITDPERVPELHRMRISAKRLRYTMEMFAPFFGPDFKEAINQFKKIQQQLGDIHDADVLVPQLTDHLRTLLVYKAPKSKHDDLPAGVRLVDMDAAHGVLSLCLSKRDERDKRYGEFLDSWKSLRSAGFFDRLWVMVQDRINQRPVEQPQEPEEPAKENLEPIKGDGHGATQNGGTSGNARQQRRKRTEPVEQAG